MSRSLASNYIHNHFESSDLLAVVLVNKQAGTVMQRLAAAEKIASPGFQAWLRHRNAQQDEIYISMNALRPDAKGRTKEDVGVIRHIYLDLDRDGKSALLALRQRSDIPPVNSVVSTSPGKWQVVWKASGFTKDQAESLQRSLARESGADVAATDCSRVLRLPGFMNHKYAEPHYVALEEFTTDVYGPQHFPAANALEWTGDSSSTVGIRKRSEGPITQSERDWAFALRALARGESREMVIATIASYRRFDKHNPQYYAELTVRKAAEALETRQARTESQDRA